MGNVISYIDNQKQHHKSQNFKTEYVGMLKSNAVKYDDRYLFDWIE